MPFCKNDPFIYPQATFMVLVDFANLFTFFMVVQFSTPWPHPVQNLQVELLLNSSSSKLASYLLLRSTCAPSCYSSKVSSSFSRILSNPCFCKRVFRLAYSLAFYLTDSSAVCSMLIVASIWS
jgi:hypothetical protein